jgi:hypothetical protein
MGDIRQRLSPRPTFLHWSSHSTLIASLITEHLVFGKDFCFFINMTKTNLALVAGLVAQSALADPLGSYNVDPTLVSVSGLSSGGYMAGQLGVAYSGTFQTGFGVFAAGPFDCARNQYVSVTLPT